MSTLSDLQKKNPHIQILPVTDASFAQYGKVLAGINADKSIAEARRMWKVADGVDYSVSVPEFEADQELVDLLSKRMYGGMPVEIGWVFGRNHLLNGLEYHQGSEVIFVLEDVVLLVALANEISWSPDAQLDTKHVKAFYAPKGSNVEMPSWCMHFVPVNVSKEAGFCNIFVLPRGTGTSIDFMPPPSPEGKLLAGKNVWILTHPDAGMNDHPALKGENIAINQLD